ncbi:hypothetical protein EON65_14555 [archaeon]|nr:MAG: hypothetical protein EON65_14555 [archaeon]
MSGIHIAMMAAARRYRQRRQQIGGPATPTFLIARDAHKTVFDGLALCDSRALLLPVEIDKLFQVSLGVDVGQLMDMIGQHHSEVNTQNHSSIDIYFSYVHCYL